MSRESKLSAAFVTLADTLIDDFDVVELLHTLVAECTEILEIAAGGLMLLDASDQLQLVASTSEEASLVEIMQLDAGAGPCVDAFTTGLPVTVGNIVMARALWPAFCDEALKQGFRSVHATPMRLRGRVIGTLNLFNVTVGELSTEDAAVAQALADVATIGILQERSIRESELVAVQLQIALDSRVLIEQAKGVIAENAGLGMNEAFATLRDYARRHNLSLSAVAAAVVNHNIDISEYISHPQA